MYPLYKGSFTENVFEIHPHYRPINSPFFLITNPFFFYFDNFAIALYFLFSLAY